MCLTLNKYNYKANKERYCKSKTKIYGYKILKRKKSGEYCSFFWENVLWPKNRKNFKSNRKGAYPNSSEYSLDGNIEICKGFHFYRTRSIARGRLKNFNTFRSTPSSFLYDLHIVKFEVQTKDIVAFNTGCGQFAATKCKKIGRIR
jgi:hypothetical protein